MRRSYGGAEMVETQLRKRGVRMSVFCARWRLCRDTNLFRSHCRNVAYADEPLAIGDGQTISQPYIVAAMTEALRLERVGKSS